VGASPIRSAILRDEPESVGVSVMLLDEKMDHGPILEQEAVLLEEWPPKGPELDALLAATGGELLAEVLPEWVAGNIDPQEQDHAAASYCGRFTKEDSKLDIDPLKLPKGAHARQAWLKINAFAGIGDTYFIHENKRVKVTKAELTEGQLQLQRVVPEGKPELDFAQYLQSLT
jgi:methionyl-tRNA formyltransferase